MSRVLGVMTIAMSFTLAACGSTGSGPQVRGNVIKIPARYTGCVEAREVCFVTGKRIEAAMRFEPQTGRHWFLDPGTGNTYFANGELRSGDPFKAIGRTRYDANPYANGIQLPQRDR